MKGMLRLPSSGWHSPSLHMLRPPAHKISYMDLPFLSTHRHLRNFAIMSDVNAHIIQPLKKFAKDSTHLVKKCTKPDRKGTPNVCKAVGFFTRPRSPCLSSHLLFKLSCYVLNLLQSLPG